MREVLEETGFDISSIISPKEFLETTVNDQLTRLYLIPGVPRNTKFIPRTRNEIRALQWFPIADLPNNKKDAMTKVRLGVSSGSFFMVFPFVRYCSCFTQHLCLVSSASYFRLLRNWVSSQNANKTQQSATSRKGKTRRKSLEEQVPTIILQRLPKANSVSCTTSWKFSTFYWKNFFIRRMKMLFISDSASQLRIRPRQRSLLRPLKDATSQDVSFLLVKL